MARAAWAEGVDSNVVGPVPAPVMTVRINPGLAAPPAIQQQWWVASPTLVRAVHGTLTRQPTQAGRHVAQSAYRQKLVKLGGGG